MRDNGLKKWKPFDSLFVSSIAKEKISEEKSKIQFPSLSEDQLEDISNKIAKAYFLKENITINYYYNNITYSVNGQIKKLDQIKKIICINDINIHFIQIISVN